MTDPSLSIGTVVRPGPRPGVRRETTLVIPAARFVASRNLVAVEVHQDGPAPLVPFSRETNRILTES